MPGMPPDKVWQGSGVHIVIEARNIGASDIEEGLIAISGYDKNLIKNLNSEGNSLKLYGRSDLIPQGEFTLIEFKNTGADIEFPEETETNFIVAPFKAVACYKYKTEAAIPVCIDTLPFDQSQNQVCSVKDFRSKAGQGAPIAIVGVNQAIVDEGADSSKAIFEIYFENLGGGDILKEEDYEVACTEQVERENLDLIKTKVFLGAEEITANCVASDDLEGGFLPSRLYEGESMVLCETSLEKGLNHFTPLIIEVSYGYSDSIQKTVEIVKS